MADLQAGAYWRSPFRALMTSKQLIEYVVLDIEAADRITGRYSLARAEVCIVYLSCIFIIFAIFQPIQKMCNRNENVPPL